MSDITEFVRAFNFPLFCVFTGMHCIYMWWGKIVEINPLISICDNAPNDNGKCWSFQLFNYLERITNLFYSKHSS